MELEELINVAKDKIGNLIQKPKMTEKLLSKPPFRFLHDTISAIITTTGYGEGLYNSQEMDSATITEKQAKLSYLDKMINFVGICQGQKLRVSSLKVVAGLEPEFTNEFLIALANCAVNKDLDITLAVQRCLSGEEPGSGPIPLRKTNSLQAESKSNDRENARTSSSEKAMSNEEKESKAPEMKSISGERGMSRSGTRGGKPTSASADMGLGGVVNPPSTPSINLDIYIEKCDGTEDTTQTLLGEIITKPKLTQKLLSKPPFRFLHDIITEVIRTTNFGLNLYTDAEMDSSQVTEKQQKMDFLDKMIRLVGIQLNTIIEAKPSKIVSGLDPQATNNFLQLLAVAAKYIPQSENAVNMVLGKPVTSTTNTTTTTASNDGDMSSRNQADAKSNMTSARDQVVDTPPIIMQAEPKSMNTTSNEDNTNSSHTRRQAKGTTESSAKETPSNETNTSTSVTNSALENDIKRSVRPSTAGRRPPRVKENTVITSDNITSKPATEVTPGGIIVEGQDDDEEDDQGMIVDETRLADMMKSDSKDDSTNTANVGAQSKLVKDILSRQAEQQQQQQQQLQNNDSKADEKVTDTSATAASGGGGGIRLMRQKGKLGSSSTTAASTTSNSSSSGGNNGPSTTTTEADVNRLRTSIQALVQHTGPLGTCMDFIQDDIEIMMSEYKKWEEECRKYEALYQEEKKRSKDILKPLEIEINDLDDQIKEKTAKIAGMKNIIYNNDEKLYEMYRASTAVV